MPIDVSFNLLTKPWIPVIRDGEYTEMNLRDVLHSAHDISAISDPLPIAEFGLYRFLVALVMDIWEFKDSLDLEDLLSAGEFDPTKIDGYFQKWGDRFDLFDSKMPFLQTADMDALPDKPLSGLLPCVPSGTAARHFHHFSESDFAVSPAAAARLLTTIAPFMTAGGAGLAPSINGAPPWYVLINGRSLFETICLNCFVGDSRLTGTAPVAWRNPLPPKTDGRCTKASLLEALTWRPRCIKLVPSGPGKCSLSGVDSPVLIRSMKFRAGASCDFTWTDPSVPYKITEKGPLVMRPQDGKEIWRDTGPLALLREGIYKSAKGNVGFNRPSLVDQFERLVVDNCISLKSLSLSAYGMRTDMKMKVFEWQKEDLCVPAQLITGSKFANFAQEAIENADRAEYAIKRAIKHLYPRDGNGNAKALETIIDNTTRQYWFILRPIYSDLLEELAAVPGDKRAEAKFLVDDKWRESVRKVAINVFDSASESFDTYGDSIQRQVEARLSLLRSLRTIFDTFEEKDAKKKSKVNTSTKGGYMQ